MFTSLQVTKADEDLKIKEEEMKKLADMAAKREADLKDIERRQQQLISVSLLSFKIFNEETLT